MKFNLKYMLFMNVPAKNITKETISSLIEEPKRRIHFATHHVNALRRTPDGKHYGTFKLPFKDSIYPILLKECGIEMFDDNFVKGGLFCYVNDETEYKRIESFIEKYRDVVFLRDGMDLSVALSVNFNIDMTRTTLGEQEYEAKYKNNEAATAGLARCCSEFLRNTPFYNVADCLVAMPSSRTLPARVVNRIEGFGGTVYIDKLSWANKRDDLKNADNTNKLDILEQSGLIISDDLDVKDKVVILLDDMYKSGVSMQYVAMKLKEVGARIVFGLSLVKSLSDKTDPNDAE